MSWKMELLTMIQEKQTLLIMPLFYFGEPCYVVMNFAILTDIKQNAQQQLLLPDTSKSASPDNGIF